MKPKLLILPKGEGKTAQLAKWVKEKGGIMICHNTTAAIKTNKKYGVNTVYPEEFIRRFHGYSPYIDRVGIDNFELYERPFILLLNYVLQSSKEVAVTMGNVFEIVDKSWEESGENKGKKAVCPYCHIPQKWIINSGTARITCTNCNKIFEIVGELE